MKKFQDSADYIQKKSFFRQILTIYGRKPVLEALNDKTLSCYRLHLAHSNKPNPHIREMEILASERNIETHYHDRQSLSRLSKNGKQDQGVCLDIHCPQLQQADDFLAHYLKNESRKNTTPLRLIALDRITNPQNLGMIIRSACAGNIHGIIIADKGNAKLDSLVIKASAGTLFKAPILRCDQLPTTLMRFQAAGAHIVGLCGQVKKALSEIDEPDCVIYILGNESEGMSKNLMQQCDTLVHIPMKNQVESLNVAVTASLIAFRGVI